MSMIVRYAASVVLLLSITSSKDLCAQVAGATLSGTITNQSGEPLPGAEIRITELATGAIRKVKTGTGGAHTLPNLLPGHYEMSVSASGFVTQVRAGIAVDVGDNIVLNVVMRPGANQTAHESHPAPSVAQATSAVKGNVNSATVESSPLNGRDWTQLATLEPGVSGIQTANSTEGHVAQRGFGAAMSISGGRPEQNSYRLDGISINGYSNGAPGSVLGANLGVDAVEQFAVLRSNYPAEYGRTSGGVINAVTRAGTNAFHGNVYEFLRNSALDARNFFDAGIPPFRRNQFGASAGGPVRKGYTFFFADYEGLRQSLGVTHVDTLPSATARARYAVASASSTFCPCPINSPSSRHWLRPNHACCLEQPFPQVRSPQERIRSLQRALQRIARAMWSTPRSAIT